MLTEKSTEIGFLLFDGFPMACLTSVIEPLRAANEIAGQEAFCWSLVTEWGQKVRSSANVRFEAECSLSNCQSIDILFLLSSPTSGFADPGFGNGALRTLARHGTILGGISGGVFPLVRSGVMTGHPVSVHWCYEAAFDAEFPDVDARREVIVSDATRYTAAGAAAAFDLALHLIEDLLGSEVAHEVACWFQHPMMRGEGVRQQVPRTSKPDTGDRLPPLVSKCVELFAGHMNEPISVAEVADQTGVTPRQVERAFKQATGQSPSHYYRAMRMKAARQMVVYTKDPIADIAAAIGYSSVAPLVTHYRSAFGLSPSEDRRRINQFRVEDNAPLPSS
ncbi:Transcriptional regulator GlxA family, contains an amidase domain and an AraC-type DNA-binding HTH domain [Ruegeria halocynthiae]|uniref:Transcriptional regulator GlxA family, contains an amidase domain and an AraC-type DNA-binding HTH domain n=1 Tax=Ruegeria halocynthiae TaxID=985054 RepID=A0A1H3ET32_9RHOB|nr:helix-turn-helix domain-containing protein [Ruegeria halocynthiae]SDX81079.1 Transcriptional regulator GlxA family, contains an amidase domain and an AraC-type DNA-binding HTH domain [Ruegeria halocynthiae]